MKKLLLIILTILTASSAEAWLMPHTYDVRTKTVSPALMTFEKVRKRAAYYTGGSRLTDDLVCIDAGSQNVFQTTSGLFIGEQNKGSASSPYNATLSTSEVWAYFPIKQITITYYPLAKFNSVTIQGAKVKESQTFTANDQEYIKATFDFDFPLQVATIATEYVGDWDTTSDLAQELGGKIRGVIISEITIDYVTDDAKTIKQAIDYCNELQNTKDISSLKDRVVQSQESSFSSRYNATSTGDINMDGKVNSADVVTIYNNIINGPEITSFEGHEYVDLGLPSGNLWATCNLGASTPEGFGDYFAWADKNGSLMTGKSSFTQSSYKSDIWYDDTSVGFLGMANNHFPQCTTEPYCKSWSKWDIPLVKDFQELIDNCTSELAFIAGAIGTRFTSKINNNTIFFPYTGKIDGTSYDMFGGYWSRSSDNAGKASALYIKLNGDAPSIEEYDRYVGNPVRCYIHKSYINAQTTQP